MGRYTFCFMYKLYGASYTAKNDILRNDWRTQCAFQTEYPILIPNDREAGALLQADLIRRIQMQKKDSQQVVVLCVGTDRATGDCLGPLVGHQLMTLLIKVFGTCHSRYMPEILLRLWPKFTARSGSPLLSPSMRVWVLLIMLAM